MTGATVVAGSTASGGCALYPGGADAGINSATALSADGSYVTFESQASNLTTGDANGITDIFVKRIR